MKFNFQTGWAVPAILMLLPLFSGCSGLAPSHSGRHGLFDDLASGSSRVHRRSSGGSTGHAIAVQDLPARPTGNPVIDKPRSKKERAEKAAAVEASPQAVELRNAGLRWPLSHVEVTSHFGKRGHEFHEGIDLRAKINTPVYAAQSGTVIYADSKIRGYGKMVVIKHHEGLATVYAHASRLLVRKGQRVKMGQRIAMSGKTGHSTGPHLHFEVRSGVVAVNPYQFLPRTQVQVAQAKPAQPHPRHQPLIKKPHSTMIAMRERASANETARNKR